MLLIPCPYCGPRAEIEFRCGGEAHVARPDPATASDEDRAEYLYYRGEPEGAASRALVPPARLRPLVQRRARHGERPVPGRATAWASRAPGEGR